MLLEASRSHFLVGPGFEDLGFWAVYMRLIEEGAGDDSRRQGGRASPSKTAASSPQPMSLHRPCSTRPVRRHCRARRLAPDKICRYEAITGLVKGSAIRARSSA